MQKPYDAKELESYLNDLPHHTPEDAMHIRQLREIVRNPTRFAMQKTAEWELNEVLYRDPTLAEIKEFTEFLLAQNMDVRTFTRAYLGMYDVPLDEDIRTKIRNQFPEIKDDTFLENAVVKITMQHVTTEAIRQYDLEYPGTYSFKMILDETSQKLHSKYDGILNNIHVTAIRLSYTKMTHTNSGRKDNESC